MNGRGKRIFEECSAVITADSIKSFEHSLDAHGDFIMDQALKALTLNFTGRQLYLFIKYEIIL